MFSSVLLLLRRSIAFREGLWWSMLDSVGVHLRLEDTEADSVAELILFINITTRTDLSDNEKTFFSIDLH
ncbi:MAG: hypothetical protein EWV76_09850 [Microcystis novacekii Mn_MB_F_20050700_S1]|uniref:Uncharacterized protein n=1 Tax=Microcystis novacekii Mn_MB_F_20050700_S1D TaxID=2486266 RepID=A0A552J475_9CHRO|nr:MAG: hypothetical protein EWV76_09850 [Microcystis novacekii Mn_MB_F_20050700_S1]TRU90364.1 MAG: hypothetical protein EWV54_06995 [Microcystis novacekii Mn_MB_F_20050700_S1D]